MAKNAVEKASAKASKVVNSKDNKSFGKKFIRFFKDLKGETKKVVWPSKKQIKNNTIVVLIFMAVAAVFVWSIDAILSLAMNLIFGA